MNILIPHSWLLEHLDTTASPEEIQKYLSLCGPSVERIYEREGEAVYDIEVTTNRVDSMSVRGIAREVAVILPQFGVKASLKPLQLPEFPSVKKASSLPTPKVKNNPRLCKRVMFLILQNIHRTETPAWMAKRLRQAEMNVHDSVIDITNYITHELGHPCHAFDYDKVMASGGEIIVKEAAKGKKFTTLDGEQYETVGGEVVFENPAGEIIDLPAIKGTANTSIHTHTKNVLLWIESLDPAKVRFGSMTHAIRTVAAQLNEKGVDPTLAEDVLAKGLQLYQELCQAEVASTVYDDFPGKREARTVSVPLLYIHTYLGLELEAQKITHILQTLGCQVTFETDGSFLIKPPTFRPDLEIPADIVEEVARIYGYHNLPSTIMDTAIPVDRPGDLHLELESRLKHFLADIGWYEVYTYSLVSEKVAAQSDHSLESHLKLQNPLSDDKVYLRRSLIPSLIEVLANNPTANDVSVFEIANTYQPQPGELPHHEMTFTFATNRNYRLVRGELEALARVLFIHNIDLEPIQKTSTGYQAQAHITAEDAQGKKQRLGILSITESGTVVGEITIHSLALVARKHPTYQPIPNTMPVIEDLTFTLPEQVAVGNVIKGIYSLSKLIKQVELKDIYQHNHTFSITYQDRTHNLAMSEVEDLRKRIVAELSSNYQAQLVGSLA